MLQNTNLLLEPIIAVACGARHGRVQPASFFLGSYDDCHLGVGNIDAFRVIK